MLLYEIPVQKVPAQILKCDVGGQQYTIELNQKGDHLYFSLETIDKAIVSYVICRDAVPLVNYGITGNFAFVDTKGNDDPDYTGLGDRFKFAWFDENG